ASKQLAQREGDGLTRQPVSLRGQMTVEAHIKVGAGSPGSEERKEIQHGEASGLCQFRPLPGRLIHVEMSRVFSVTRRQPPEPVGIDLEFDRDDYDQGGDS